MSRLLERGAAQSWIPLVGSALVAFLLIALVVVANLDGAPDRGKAPDTPTPPGSASATPAG